jgi:hypothetical protein
MEELPTYKITIDEEYNDGVEPLGLDAIAFTSQPAVMVKGVAFKSHVKMAFADEKKYRITAPAMIPMEIYRRDEDGSEYYVEFTEDEIDTIFKDFMSGLNNKDLFNLEHEGEKIVPAYILEAWIVQDPKKDKAFSTFGIDVPKGTLMMTAQVTDTDYYNKLVADGAIGFSIEGYLGLKLSNQINQNSMPELEEGKKYIVKDGQLVEVTEEVAMAEEVVEETEVTEEEKTEEVEMAEETVEEEKEEVEVEMAVDPAADAEAILAIVNPVIEERVNELLQVIAELKNELTESTDDEPVEEVEMKLSAHQRFSNTVNFLKQNG